MDTDHGHEPTGKPEKEGEKKPVRFVIPKDATNDQLDALIDHIRAMAGLPPLTEEQKREGEDDEEEDSEE